MTDTTAEQDVVDILTTDHHEFLALIDDIKANPNGDVRRDLADTLIAELVMAIEFGASAEDVARICHAHPSLNEAVKEAALAADGRALHI